MNWKKGCLLAFCALVVLVGVALALAFYMTSGAVASADRFLQLLGSGDVEAAYQAAAPALQQQQSAESFGRAVSRMGLTEFASRSWSHRSVEGGQAELTGTFTTRSGDEIPLEVSLIKAEGEWRVLALSGPQAGAAVTGPAAAPELPQAGRLEELARESLLALNRSVVSRDFSTFYAGISDLWRQQTTPEELAAAFSAFVERDIDFAAIAELEPSFEPAPAIDGEGALRIAGIYPTTPARLAFQLRYLREAGEWKLLAIKVDFVQ